LVPAGSAAVFATAVLCCRFLLLTLLIGRRSKSLIIFRDQNACHSAKSKEAQSWGSELELRVLAVAVKAMFTIGFKVAFVQQEKNNGCV